MIINNNILPYYCLFQLMTNSRHFNNVIYCNYTNTRQNVNYIDGYPASTYIMYILLWYTNYVHNMHIITGLYVSQTNTIPCKRISPLA